MTFLVEIAGSTNLPDCPYCGGKIPKKGVQICMHCNGKLAWVASEVPYKPNNAGSRKAAERKRQLAFEAEQRRKEASKQATKELAAGGMVGFAAGLGCLAVPYLITAVLFLPFGTFINCVMLTTAVAPAIGVDSSNKLYLWAGSSVIFLAFVVWLFRVSKPTRHAAYIAQGATFLILIGCIYFGWVENLSGQTSLLFRQGMVIFGFVVFGLFYWSSKLPDPAEDWADKNNESREKKPSAQKVNKNRRNVILREYGVDGEVVGFGASGQPHAKDVDSNRRTITQVAPVAYYLKRGETIRGPLERTVILSAATGKKLLSGDQIANSKDGPWQDITKEQLQEMQQGSDVEIK